MNIQEAIRSGRPFRRKDWDESGWCHVVVSDDYGIRRVEFITGDNNDFVAHEADLLADDWEVQQVPVPITPHQFWDAYRDALVDWQKEDNLYRIGAEAPASNIVGRMAKKLGIQQ